MKTLDLKNNQEFLKWAKRATAGIDASGVMLGILSDRQIGARWEFAIQIGHCLLENKPLVLLAPVGAEVPEKLRAAATVLEWFAPHNEDSLMAATRRALDAAGLPVRH